MNDKEQIEFLCAELKKAKETIRKIEKKYYLIVDLINQLETKESE